MSERIFLNAGTADGDSGPAAGSAAASRPVLPAVLVPVVRALRSGVGEHLVPVTEQVLPDGAVHLLFDVGDHPAVTVHGPTMTATPVRLAGRIEQVGVELAPGAVASALGVPAHSLRGGTWDLNDVAGAWAQEWLARLFVTGPSQRIDVITALLAERMRSAPVPDWRAAAATKALTRHPAAPGEARGVSELAERNGLSARQLEQVFRDTVGLSPREMRRLSRFHRLCRLLGRHETSAGLAATALEAGYSDQAHASRETKRISGLTLKQMRDRGFVQDTPDRLPED